MRLRWGTLELEMSGTILSHVLQTHSGLCVKITTSLWSSEHATYLWSAPSFQYHRLDNVKPDDNAAEKRCKASLLVPVTTPHDCSRNTSSQHDMPDKQHGNQIRETQLYWQMHCNNVWDTYTAIFPRLASISSCSSFVASSIAESSPAHKNL
jgi:hypothetical protein